MGRRGNRRLAALVMTGSLTMAACSSVRADVHVLASDAMGGRDNATAGSARAQDYIIDRIDRFAVGIGSSARGRDAFRQPFEAGTNIVALIPGRDLANEYVIVGAHYDHLGSACRTADPADTICNGATDNAAGVAAVLALGEKLASQAAGPRRSVILALWDREEDGLLGSRFYVNHPLVPLAATVAYINFDIQGANVLPSLRTTTFALGAETGGDRLVSAVARASRPGPLQTHSLSWIFGQGRSDYLNFIQAQVPTVFFSDSTGPCYHTAQDDASAVDLWKLGHELKTAYRLAHDLADGPDIAHFAAATPLATYDDAVELRVVAHQANADLARFSSAQQAVLLAFEHDLDEIVAAGPANFGPGDVTTLLTGAANAVRLFTSGSCEAFTPH